MARYKSKQQITYYNISISVLKIKGKWDHKLHCESATATVTAIHKMQKSVKPKHFPTLQSTFGTAESQRVYLFVHKHKIPLSFSVQSTSSKNQNGKDAIKILIPINYREREREHKP